MENLIQRIFSRFRNLNLRVLIDDLRHGNVERGRWVRRIVGSSTLCPLAHGWQMGCNLITPEDSVCRATGASNADVLHFVAMWDESRISGATMLAVLESIWEERQADADAVQAVLEDPILRPMSPAEAAYWQAAYDAAEAVPLSAERIQEIVDYAVGR